MSDQSIDNDSLKKARNLQPALIWFRALEYMKLNYDIDLQDHNGRLLIFHTEKPGCWVIQNAANLYWDEDISDGHYGNAESKELYENSDYLRECMVSVRKRQYPIPASKLFFE